MLGETRGLVEIAFRQTLVTEYWLLTLILTQECFMKTGRGYSNTEKYPY